MASAAKAMGYTPYWMDLNGYPQTTCTKVISAQNDLYSLGSRLSKNALFNKLVWEPTNYETFRQLKYNASDQKNAELMQELSRDGKYEITSEMKDNMKDFYGNYASEGETAQTIKDLYEKTGYVIDTHTAVAATVLHKYRPSLIHI